MNDPDQAFDLLVRSFTVRSDEGLVEIRRSGDEAVLMFRWRPYPYLFGVPVSLTQTDRRLDWDRPAADLDEWVDSVDLWRMETLENGWTLQGRRSQVADYIELRGPAWPYDDRFFVDVVDPTDEHGWLRTDFISADGINPQPAIERRRAGTLVAWVTSCENNSTGSPYVGAATVVRVDDRTARLDSIEVIDQAPITLALDVVRVATHAAADTGAQTVVTSLDLDHLDILGFKATGTGELAVDTHFLDEDPEAYAVVLARALASPGRWGSDRDSAGRYLPNNRVGRLLHRLRHGSSGRPPRIYAG